MASGLSQGEWKSGPARCQTGGCQGRSPSRTRFPFQYCGQILSADLVLTKCLDCGAVGHRIIKTDMLVYCSECRSEAVIWPYSPKLETRMVIAVAEALS